MIDEISEKEAAEYAKLAAGPCGWKYCGEYGCILAEDGKTPCEVQE